MNIFLIFSLSFSLALSASAWVLFSLQVDRLMEMHFKYLEAVQQADKRIEGEKHVSPPPPPLAAVLFTLALYRAACWMKVFRFAQYVLVSILFFSNHVLVVATLGQTSSSSDLET